MLKRLLCRVLGHRPTKVPREDEGGWTMRCARCGLEGTGRPRPR
ncbi:hypothetical protein [Cellulomonas aerilata]|nr:hypothetical protein [Cellulomonas aerilata]